MGRTAKRVPGRRGKRACRDGQITPKALVGRNKSFAVNVKVCLRQVGRVVNRLSYPPRSMATRGSFGIRYRGKRYAFYNHYSSGLDFLGVCFVFEVLGVSFGELMAWCRLLQSPDADVVFMPDRYAARRLVLSDAHAAVIRKYNPTCPLAPDWTYADVDDWLEGELIRKQRETRARMVADGSYDEKRYWLSHVGYIQHVMSSHFFLMAPPGEFNYILDMDTMSIVMDHDLSDCGEISVPLTRISTAEEWVDVVESAGVRSVWLSEM